ncbi:hypothetical protein N7527_001933 [Penicillium freii]|nr:hypothetical protein N7527_001933 [Penicillium freii]
MVNTVYIVGAARTPTAPIDTSLRCVPATTLGAIAIQQAVSRSHVPPDLFSDVHMGLALQAGVGQAPAKQAAIQGGLASEIEAITINKVCASGLRAVISAAQNIQLDHAAAQVAGGMESMSNAPRYLKRGEDPELKEIPILDGLTLDGLTNPWDGRSMGACADEVADRMAISRKDQDDYAIRSYERFRHACKTGAHCEEIAPVSLTSGATGLVAADHLPHESVFNRIRKLSSCFSIGGTITSGNASSLSDGASAVALVNAELARSFCLSNRILAKIVTYADASAAPHEFAMAPAKAIQKVLACAHLSVEQIDLWEINEAFAMVVLVTQQVRNSPITLTSFIIFT